MATFCGHSGENWATFNSSIWSHTDGNPVSEKWFGFIFASDCARHRTKTFPCQSNPVPPYLMPSWPASWCIQKSENKMIIEAIIGEIWATGGQCDQVGRNFTTLARFQKSLAIFLRVNLVFGKILGLLWFLGKFHC